MIVFWIIIIICIIIKSTYITAIAINMRDIKIKISDQSNVIPSDVFLKKKPMFKDWLMIYLRVQQHTFPYLWNFENLCLMNRFDQNNKFFCHCFNYLSFSHCFRLLPNTLMWRLIWSEFKSSNIKDHEPQPNLLKSKSL